MTSTADNPRNEFRLAVTRLSEQWLAAGLPSRQGLDEAARDLERLRCSLKIEGVWERPPVMVTATIDDGLGQGMAVIEKFADTIGMRLISLGLMQPPAVIIDACHRHRPAFLGLTVLQFDSEEDLRAIFECLPAETRLIAGGPVFAGDPDFARRTGTHYAAKNVADFLYFILDSACQPPPNRQI